MAVKTLLCVLEHPTQYDPPLWACLERRGRLHPRVWYLDAGVPPDPEIGRNVGWGTRERTRDEEEVREIELARRLLALRPAPDAVLTAGLVCRSTWQVWGLARARGIPVLLPTDRVRENDGAPTARRRVRALAREALQRGFDGFVTTGQRGVEALQASGIPTSRIATGLYPIDGEGWRTRARSLEGRTAELRASVSGRAVVLAVSKLSERENPLLVLEGFDRLRRRRDAVLLYVGDGPMRRQVEAYVQALGLDVRLLGYVPYPELPAYFAAADVFVHVPKREPWGISVSEAMALGVPVVASEVVGAGTDLIVSGRTGERVPLGDGEALASALERILAWPKARVRADVLAQVTCMDVTHAAQELEQLVEVVRAPAAWTPLPRVLWEVWR